ncbi:DUF4245 domain-containing protein [Streptomyces pactum]|uniref:DUF4245 domain-containing protein n=1 Tax=Streptomyces pactum TaxID=68249 RepID=A0ABS0NNK8_9ACTN|nr:DUF4245 domain-containing protein [Streptomyces pactum]MBH5336768.1 DUF4245 domain-containing protein [Streptomyces pactum]
MGDHVRVAGKRGNKTIRGMVQSLGVTVVVAGLIYVFIPHDEDHDPIRTVDYRVELQTVRRAAPYPVAAPEPGGLPEGWRATSVRYTPESKDGAAWHLGFLDADREYVAVEQSDGRPAAFVGNVTHGARETDRTERVNGREWTWYKGPKYNALVLQEEGVTTVVTGTAPYGHLVKMAAALQTRKG